MKKIIKFISIFFALTNGWKCCKCGEEHHRGEWTCNYCKHERCSKCKGFQA